MLLESVKFQGYIQSFWIDSEIIGTTQIDDNVDSRGVEEIPFTRYTTSVDDWSVITSTTLNSENVLRLDANRNGTVFVTNGLISKDTWEGIFVDYHPEALLNQLYSLFFLNYFSIVSYAFHKYLFASVI